MSNNNIISPGFYNINKPMSWTSFDVVKKIKVLSREKKVGHAGTLDPMATGVLVVAVGKEFTKKLTTLSIVDKEYEFEVTFGIGTDTYDLEGDIVYKQRPNNITFENINNIIEKFIGNIEQLPPKYSAVKKNGKKLYEYARKGIEVEIEPRAINIYELELINFQDEEFPKAYFRSKVSKGTYIRTLAYDLGKALNTVSVCSSLVRTSVGDYKLSDSIEINSLSE
jgi:tRNA pseudouridine55 synthase